MTWEAGLPGKVRIWGSGQVVTVIGRLYPLVVVSCGPYVARSSRSSCGCLIFGLPEAPHELGCARVEGAGQRIMRSAAA